MFRHATKEGAEGLKMLKEYVAEFAKYKKLGIQTLAQLSDAALNVAPAAEANSIGVIVRHLHGNLISRFTDFMTTDGEKEWRDRAAEFAEVNYARAEVEAYWTAAWSQLETVLAGLNDDDLPKTVIIKGEAMTTDAALCRALAHVAYHVGQIVFLAKHYRSAGWNSLSIPRNRSAEFNAFLGAQPPAVADREKQFDVAANFSQSSSDKK